MHKCFASILVDNKKELPAKKDVKENTTVGIDLGIKYFLTTSSGLSFDNPSFLKLAISKLKYTQRKWSNHKGKRTKHKLAIIHGKVANQRKDFLHKSSIQLIRENQSIAIEDLNIEGMVRNRNFSRSISDVGWGEFVRQLRYKADWYGKNIIQIGRFDPSSKTCSVCGSINKNLKLSEREWTCNSCNSVLDRDINAAINIKNFALKNYLSVERRLENQNELPTLVGVMTSEADNIY